MHPLITNSRNRMLRRGDGRAILAAMRSAGTCLHETSMMDSFVRRGNREMIFRSSVKLNSSRPNIVSEVMLGNCDNARKKLRCIGGDMQPSPRTRVSSLGNNLPKTRGIVWAELRMSR